jgi:hypothetical protein
MAAIFSERELFLALLKKAGVGEESAIAEADRRFGPATISLPDVERAREKEIEHAGDVLMQKLGFEVIRFSHPGKTMQTPGIADRRYYRRPRTVERRDGQFITAAIAVWWEAKSATGEQRPGQKLFQELVTACGEQYVLGGIDELAAWLVAQKIAQLVDGALEPL